jgi:hypothetical protein
MTKQVITTNDVTIKQAVIEVKVLKIGKRQVTQAVFKQLPEEPIIHERTGELLGEAWGRVNYHVGCSGAYEHLHVVWQRGNLLYRSVANVFLGSSRWQELHSATCKYATAYVAAKVLEGWRPEASFPERYTLYPTDDWGLEADEGYKGIGLRMPKCLTSGWYKNGATKSLERHRDANVQVEHLLELYKVPNDSIAIREKFLVPALHEQRVYESIWQQSYSQLQQLEQLFIAV